MDDKLTIFIAITACAFVAQALILLVMMIAMLKLRTRMEALADKVEDTVGVVNARVLPLLDDVKTRVFPLLDDVKTMQQDIKSFMEVARPKVDVILDNATHITTTARGSAERIDATINDVVDRVRLQVIRGDEMLTRTMDRVEETSEKVQHTVMSPVRQVSGIMQAISTGVGSYFNNKKGRRNGGPNEEMFI